MSFSKLAARTIALGYLTLLLAAPVVMIFYTTFEHGLAPVWTAINEPNAVHAFWLSIEIVAIAVPLNTAFGVGMALLLERGKFKGKVLLGMLIDLPFAISPVVVGLALVLVYGKTGWFGNWLIGHGIQIIFSVPGMVIATAVVSLPFVARETAPVLRELGTDAEQAAATLGASGWQTFWRITLPAIRWGVVYGVVLTTARALGEIGAVAVVSSNVLGSTVSLPLLVKYRTQVPGPGGISAAYATGTELAVMSLIVLIGMTLLAPQRKDA